ncbi:MAG: integrase arm-type DNA-binding domain-containing protein [Candidatus Thiodiazotropha lotti]|nr:integrase arm-type DNA-binding domain-containing protein [Candidatus Thiodiazotropha lotti]MCW4221350.1 integrase arm-type DNA-binding domain-containing protein [Candidatus Thiodiazotropha lotti]
MAGKNSIPFTDKALANLKPKAKDYELGDAGCPGLRLRVSPSGKKVFRWYYQEADGKRRVKTLGIYDDISLSKARQDLESLKEQHQEALEHGESLTRDHVAATVNELAEEFYTRRIVPNRKRPDVVRLILDNDINPTLGKRKLRTLKAPTVRAAVEAVVDRGATTHAGKVLAILKQMFRFGVSRGDMDHNPAEALDPLALGVESNIRDRVLDAKDLKAFWFALDNAPRMSDQVKAGLRVLTLTGVRTSELLKAQWKNVNLKQAEWTIPIADQKLSPKQAKKAKPWVVPLSQQSIVLFEELKSYAVDGKGKPLPYVMASQDSAEGHYTSKALGRAVRRLFELEIKQGEEPPPSSQLSDSPPTTCAAPCEPI